MTAGLVGRCITLMPGWKTEHDHEEEAEPLHLGIWRAAATLSLDSFEAASTAGKEFQYKNWECSAHRPTSTTATSLK